MNYSFTKLTYAQLTYITMQFFVYFYMFQLNFAIFREPIYQYSKLTKI